VVYFTDVRKSENQPTPELARPLSAVEYGSLRGASFAFSCLMSIATFFLKMNNQL
jgi:hypothetical protein